MKAKDFITLTKTLFNKLDITSMNFDRSSYASDELRPKYENEGEFVTDVVFYNLSYHYDAIKVYVETKSKPYTFMITEKNDDDTFFDYLFEQMFSYLCSEEEFGTCEDFLKENITKEKAFLILLDYVDGNTCESDINIVGTYRTFESAKQHLKKWRNGLLSGDSWESNAYKMYQEDGDDCGYYVDEDDTHFEIAENGRYTENHTYCSIKTLFLED